MSKDKLLPISIFALAFSIIISASIISEGLTNNGMNIGSGISQGANIINPTNINENSNEKSIFSAEEASVYLGIAEERLMQIINNEESKIPYVKVGGDFIFSKNALDKWIQESNFKM